MNGYELPMLPPKVDLETKPVLRQLAKSHRALAELKGYAATIPNKHMLINAVTINEAKDSSAIENIITTHDELYKAISQASYKNPAAKEVARYRTAMWHGYEMVRGRQLLTTNMIIDIHAIIETNRGGIRKLPGTVLRNDTTGEVIYTPPSGEHQILQLMSNLEKYINDASNGVDPLIKMAVLHYQFESIHPFYDGNGRTGRIVNVLYLVLKELLDSPILYLSRYIIDNKDAYYGLLKAVRSQGNWEDWILFILQGVEETAEQTLILAKTINAEMEAMAAEIRDRLPKIYSRDLMEQLFFEFYTKIAYVEKGLGVARRTAATYLEALEREGFLVSEKLGKERIYQNKRLFDLVKGQE
ncbi:MAG TPA: Fic family protein [Cyclobacteriaceae bacterium]|nr:Fic family protein [Cyclobacteriaceae bacterium]